MWSRVKVIPFNKRYDDELQNKNLKSELKLEKAGVFNWLVEGAHKYNLLGRLGDLSPGISSKNG
jgi:phage/plasmid-associated DNA primase